MATLVSGSSERQMMTRICNGAVIALTSALSQTSAFTCGNGSHSISTSLDVSRCRVPRMCPRRSCRG